jgi:quercetin dioxygenase-like cupin family protein
MEIFKEENIIRREFEKEKRSYYLPEKRNFEVIVTEMKPGDVQEHHYHKKVSETYYVLSGQVVFNVQNIKNGEEAKKIFANKGDVIQIYPFEMHNVENLSKKKAEILTLKFVKTPKSSEKHFSDEE